MRHALHVVILLTALAVAPVVMWGVALHAAVGESGAWMK